MKTTNNRKTNGADPPLAPESITFRIDMNTRRVLGECAARHGVSAHEMARFYLKEFLLSKDPGRQIGSDDPITEAISELRLDVALSTRALLTKAGRMNAPEADAWARTNLHLVPTKDEPVASDRSDRSTST